MFAKCLVPSMHMFPSMHILHVCSQPLIVPISYVVADGPWTESTCISHHHCCALLRRTTPSRGDSALPTLAGNALASEAVKLMRKPFFSLIFLCHHLEGGLSMILLAVYCICLSLSNQAFDSTKPDRDNHRRHLEPDVQSLHRRGCSCR